MFSFQKKGTGKFDRIFSIFFFKAIVIDIVCNGDLNLDLQLPTYKNVCQRIGDKLTEKDLKATKEFYQKYQGKIKDRKTATETLQNYFKLTDCDISM